MRSLLVRKIKVFTLASLMVLVACGGSSGEQPPNAESQADANTQNDPATATTPGPDLSGNITGLVTSPVTANGREITITRRYALTLESTGENQYSGTSTIRTLETNDVLARYSVNASYADNALVVTELAILETQQQREPAAREAVTSSPELDCLAVIEFEVNMTSDGPLLAQKNPEASVLDCVHGVIYATWTEEPITSIWHELLPDCPCDYPEAQIRNGTPIRDIFGRPGQWAQLDVRDDFHPGATYEARWVPDASGAGQQCTYDSNKKLITEGLAAGTPDTRSPGKNKIDYFEEFQGPIHYINDVVPFSEVACATYLEQYPPNNGNSCPSNRISVLPPQASESLTCSDIIAASPISELPMAPGNEDDTPSPVIDNNDPDIPVVSVSYTDPHLVTIDGLGYSFQAVGEFVLMKSEIEGYEIQARQSQYGGRTSQASVNTGFAFDIHGTRVSIVNSPEEVLTAYINGEPQFAPGLIDLPEGGSVEINPDTFQIRWVDGTRAIIKDRRSFLNLSLGLADQHAGRITGLLGNFDDDTENDLTTSNGTNITTNPAASDLYGIYADSWRVTNDSSLFDYFDGQNTDSFTNLLFPSSAVTFDDLDENDIALARTQCTLAGVTNEQLLESCILDLVLSGETLFIDGILDAQENLATTIVGAEISGDIGAGSLVCETTQFSELFSGSLTNPDARLLWDMELSLRWCDESVSGEMIIVTEDWTQHRRIRGAWVQGQLDVSASYPYNRDSERTSIVRNACYGMALSLAGDASVLAGSWTAANCPQGGEINLSRKLP